MTEIWLKIRIMYAGKGLATCILKKGTNNHEKKNKRKKQWKKTIKANNLQL